MTLEEVKQLKIGDEVSFIVNGLICGSKKFTGIILRTATDKNIFSEIKYTRDAEGYCNIVPENILSKIE